MCEKKIPSVKWLLKDWENITESLNALISFMKSSENYLFGTRLDTRISESVYSLSTM